MNQEITEESRIRLRGTFEGREVNLDRKIHVMLSDGWYDKRDTAFVTKVGNTHYRTSSPLITQLRPDIYGSSTYCLNKEAEKDYLGKTCLARDLVSINVFIVSASSIERKEIRLHTSDCRTGVRYVDSEGNASPWPVLFVDARDGSIVLSFRKSVTNRYLQDIGLSGKFVVSGNMLMNREDAIMMHPSYDTHFIHKRAIGGAKIIEIEGYFHYSDHVRHVYSDNIVDGNPEIIGFLDNTYTGHHFNFNKRTRIVYRLNREVIANQFSRSHKVPESISKNILEILDSGQINESTISKSSIKGLCDLARMIESRIEGFANPFCILENKSAEFVDVAGLLFYWSDDIRLIRAIDEVKRTNYYYGSYIMPMVVKANQNTWMCDENTGAGTHLSDKNLGDTGGDFVWYKPRKGERPPFVPSPSLLSTGGLGYTFGVELETSYGVIPKDVCRDINVSAVGDRSIGALEYVTDVLHGDNGMNELSNICDTIRRFTLVDDRCGLHVHIGGAEGTDVPFFSRYFSMAAIILGIKIEKELFDLLPDNRMLRRNSSGQSYCGSILEYEQLLMDYTKDLIAGRATKEQIYNIVLSHFVTGGNNSLPLEDFKPDKIPTNRGIELGRWASSRYKWLNLINCNTDNTNRRNGGGFRTIEFRAYNGTTRFSDVYWFVLLSLVFTKFAVKNKFKIIPSDRNVLYDPSHKITIRQMIEDVIHDDNIRLRMINWMDERKLRIKESRENKKANK